MMMMMMIPPKTPRDNVCTLYENPPSTTLFCPVTTMIMRMVHKVLCSFVVHLSFFLVVVVVIVIVRNHFFF